MRATTAVLNRFYFDTLTVESGLYYLEPQFGGQTRTFHRPHLSYLAIDFHYLHFDLQMKVNAGGCTHQYKLEVDSVFNVFTLRINFMHLRACTLGDYPVPRHMWICIVAGGTSSLPKYLLVCM